MKYKNKLSYNYVNKIISYDEITGNLTWKVNKSRRSKIGDVLGSIKYCRHIKYISISIDNEHYYAHRIAWLLFYKEWPKNNIDHINGNGMDNSIKNLRDVDQSGNMKNSILHKHNTSGVAGVSWCNNQSKWRSSLIVNGKQISLGMYNTLYAAAYARHAGNIEYNFSLNHGRTY